jgi:hypothetical protein
MDDGERQVAYDEEYYQRVRAFFFPPPMRKQNIIVRFFSTLKTWLKR